MILQLVPHRVTTTSASIWLGVFGTHTRPGDVHIQFGSQTWSAPAGAWTAVQAGGYLALSDRTVWTQTVTVEPFSPGDEVRLTGTLQTEQVSCRFRTLPQQLPTEQDSPFTILIGSCFAYFQDEAGLAGTNLANLPAPFKPALKILAGDQVYLDNPATEVLPRAAPGLAKRLLDKYVTTWTQGGGWGGFSRVLAEGGTYFLADDHEFWNNHPNWSPLIAFRGPTKRAEWIQIAGGLYREFQTLPGQQPAQAQQFSIEPVDVFLADTRFGRDLGSSRFMDQGELAKLLNWLAGPADRPGVLVIGAPLFTEPAGWIGSWLADRSLANYKDQYRRLAQAVLDSPRSLLILSGDIHCGRVAEAVGLSPQDIKRRITLFELISSPLALVSNLAGGKFEPAPARFPVEVAPGGSRIGVETRQWDKWNGAGQGLDHNQFMTLSFTQVDQAVNVRAVVWEINNRTPHIPIRRGEYDCKLPRR